MSDTLIVNLFGGPGTGKSTTAAQLFSMLKTSGYNAEIAHEFAKDLTWEQRTKTLQFQPYVIGKQMYRIWRLIGEVEVVVTDSPILLGLIYGLPDKGYDFNSFRQFVLATHKRWNTLNVRLVRNNQVHPYNPRGRNQTKEEAESIDNSICSLLHYNGIGHIPVVIGEKDWAASIIYKEVQKRL